MGITVKYQSMFLILLLQRSQCTPFSLLASFLLSHFAALTNTASPADELAVAFVVAAIELAFAYLDLFLCNIGSEPSCMSDSH